MNMIRHPTVNLDGHRVLFAGRHKQASVNLPVLRLEKDIRSADASPGDVMRKAGNHDSLEAGHEFLKERTWPRRERSSETRRRGSVSIAPGLYRA